MHYALSGSLAAATIAPVAPARLAVLYVEDASRAISELELTVVETGANILLIEPRDPGVFDGTVVEDDLRFVSPVQAAADLLTSSGRGPSEADALIDWLSENEERWRG